jgi:hypothetical protein
MIAEYERAKSSNATGVASGMPHRQRVNVLSGAPYGYLYVKMRWWAGAMRSFPTKRVSFASL